MRKEVISALFTAREGHEATVKDFQVQMLFYVMEGKIAEAVICYKILAKISRDVGDTVPMILTK